MTTVPGPPSRLRPLLLTALVWPGLGQWSERQHVRALLFGGTALGAAAAFVWILFHEVLRRIPQDAVFVEPADAWRLAHQIVGTAGGALQGWIVVLIAAWAVAVLDSVVSYQRGRRASSR